MTKTGWTHSWPENTEKPTEFSGSEVKVFGFAVANLAGTIPGTNTPKHWRDTHKLLAYVKKLDGFLGVHPVPPHGTILMIKTENDAKRAHNLLTNDLKTQTGYHILPFYIPAEYAKGGTDHAND